ncbi:hypothetical protein JX265_003203 [Neoarthrinium moseri]|uniref:Uncharacterized protein n=1 Tax=Neoarthrinium moseri TaxID=1658444 RepID=A0A9Q0AT30_9PEZI|nr:hypothetical protein JX265_003203 [Neoarthrinium moseri]
MPRSHKAVKPPQNGKSRKVKKTKSRNRVKVLGETPPRAEWTKWDERKEKYTDYYKPPSQTLPEDAIMSFMLSEEGTQWSRDHGYHNGSNLHGPIDKMDLAARMRQYEKRMEIQRREEVSELERLKERVRSPGPETDPKVIAKRKENDEFLMSVGILPIHIWEAEKKLTVPVNKAAVELKETTSNQSSSPSTSPPPPANTPSPSPSQSSSESSRKPLPESQNTTPYVSPVPSAKSRPRIPRKPRSSSTKTKNEKKLRDRMNSAEGAPNPSGACEPCRRASRDCRVMLSDIDKPQCAREFSRCNYCTGGKLSAAGCNINPTRANARKAKPKESDRKRKLVDEQGGNMSKKTKFSSDENSC